jgi:N-acetylglucosaminyl-diphospho-decaprenol L-rhamnosyltransferase
MPVRGEPLSAHATLDVIIATATGSLDLLEACLSSLQDASSTLPPLSVTVVDNASRDGLVETVRARYPSIAVHALSQNRGFAAAVNFGITHTSGGYVLLLNPDTEVPRGAIDRLVSVLDRVPDAGLVGPRLVDRSGRPDHNAKRTFPTPAAALRHFLGLKPRKGVSGYALADVDEFEQARVDAISGSCMLARRHAIERVGLLDEGYWMYGEDLDWCRRFGSHGWRVFYAGDATVLHVKHGVSGEHPSLRLNWAFHRAMGRFYRRFESGRYPTLDVVVYVGILTKFVMSVGRAWLRRLSS